MGKKDPNKKKKKGKKAGSKAKDVLGISDLRAIQIKMKKNSNRQYSATKLDSSQNQGYSKTPVKAGMHTARKTSDIQQQLSFYFPFTPQQIQYANMSPELSEIQRPGKSPIVAFNRFRARQISLKLLLAVPQDGLVTSIDKDIEYLYKMANSAIPVYFTNMDKQVSNPLGSTTDPSSQKVFWSIIDLNFSSVRRNANNEVVVAEANLTLTENANPISKIADLPRISYTEAPPQTPRASSGTKEGDYLTVTEVRHIINTDTSDVTSSANPTGRV